MQTFPIHDTQSAEPEAASVLTGVEAQLGFIPNVFGLLANSVPALAAFADLNGRFGASSLSAVERETVQLAASVARGSEYCVAGHTRFARDQKIDETVVGSLRTVEPVADGRLDALARFTRALVRSDGRAGREELEGFLQAGYTSAQALEVILGICVKTMSNLASNTFGIPLDDAFSSCAWQAPV
jgi:AhpD family alkylhydroperoxidase